MEDRSNLEIDKYLSAAGKQVSKDNSDIDDGKLLAYARGTLNEEQVEAVEAHLATNANSRELLAAMRQVPSQELSSWAEQQVLRAGQGTKKRPWSVGLLATVAVAAAVLFTVKPKDAGFELPAYTLEGPLGGVHAQRAAGDATQTFLPDSYLEFVLRPEEATEADRKLYVFNKTESGYVPVRMASQQRRGTYSIRTQLKDSFLDSFGEKDIYFLVCKPGTEDSSKTLKQADFDSLSKHCPVRLRAQIEYLQHLPK